MRLVQGPGKVGRHHTIGSQFRINAYIPRGVTLSVRVNNNCSFESEGSDCQNLPSRPHLYLVYTKRTGEGPCPACHVEKVHLPLSKIVEQIPGAFDLRRYSGVPIFVADIERHLSEGHKCPQRRGWIGQARAMRVDPTEPTLDDARLWATKTFQLGFGQPC